MVTFLRLYNDLSKAIADSLKALGVTADFSLFQPSDDGHGDLSTNVYFLLSKFGNGDGALADNLIKEIKQRVGPIVSVERHSSGYINFRLNPSALDEFLRTVIREAGFPMEPISRQRVTIEHTAVNPNKALHVGHARNLVLGDVMYRSLKRGGWDVEVLNYIDDTGVQIADIILGFKELGFSLDPAGKKFDHYCGDDVYVGVNRALESDEVLREKRSHILRELEDGGPISSFAAQLVKRILDEELKTSWALGAHYDLLNWESHFLLGGYWRDMFELLLAKGLIVKETSGKYQGCWVLTGDNGENKVLVRSDGTAVYTAKDLAYAGWKLGLLNDHMGYDVYARQPDGTNLLTTTLGGSSANTGFRAADETIIVIGQEQRPIQEMIARTIERIDKRKRYRILAYGAVALSNDTAARMGFKVEGSIAHMSGRSGLYINVDDLLSLLEKTALEEVENRNPNAIDKPEIARGVALGAIRYSILRQDLDKLMVLDMESALRLDGDTGPYIQYTLARAKKILRKVGEPAEDVYIERVLSAEERNLLILLFKYDYILKDVVDNLTPNKLAIYARKLAVSFNTFYERRRILGEPDAQTRNSRLAIVKAYELIMGDIFGVLGLPVLEEM
ncbi:MAG: arginine--tRNA ligase [Nitrososphaerota archaeon]|nr:arginine--tRNA ligase [Nitrososphaerota archaeon]